jgi:hypothetical protein
MGAVIGAAPRGGTKRNPERHVETHPVGQTPH